MIAPIRKLSLQTEATIAKIEIVEIETTSLRSKYAGEKAGAGPGGRKKLIKGKIGDWELLKQMEMKEREKDEAVAERAKGNAERATGTRRGTGSISRASGTAQKAKVCLTQIFARSENSLTKPKATTPVPDSPMPSDAIGGSDYESTPSCSNFWSSRSPGWLLRAFYHQGTEKAYFLEAGV